MKHATLSANHIKVKRNEKFELAIDHLEVVASEIVCVAGPNGSGKSTLIQTLAGLVKPDTGTTTIDGHKVDNNLRPIKKILGYIPDDDGWLINELTAAEFFELLAGVYAKAGVIGDLNAKVNDLAEKLYFTSFNIPLERLSHGNKKKVQIIAGLMHSPKIIIVDELRNGLDPLAIIAAEQIIRAKAKAGACVFAATHDLWWAERISDRLLLLLDGKIATEARTKQLVKKHGSIEKLFIELVENHRKLNNEDKSN